MCHARDCHGARYNSATLEVLYNDKSIGDVMEMTLEQAAAFFAAQPKIHRPLSLLCDTGLGYLKLGQPSPTLSGGEAQRLKLVSELTRGVGRSQTARLRQNRETKSILYLLEEPTIGLHMADVAELLKVLHRLVDDGSTVIVIEHNLSLVAEADYVIDIGPEAGEAGWGSRRRGHAGSRGQGQAQPHRAIPRRRVGPGARPFSPPNAPARARKGRGPRQLGGIDLRTPREESRRGAEDAEVRRGEEGNESIPLRPSPISPRLCG